MVALTAASMKGNIEIVRELISRKDIDVNIQTILIKKHSCNSKPTFSTKLKFPVIYGVYIDNLILQH